MQAEKACVCQRLSVREGDVAGSAGGAGGVGTQDEAEREREAPWTRWWWFGFSGSRNKDPYLGSSVHPFPSSHSLSPPFSGREPQALNIHAELPSSVFL